MLVLSSYAKNYASTIDSSLPHPPPPSPSSLQDNAAENIHIIYMDEDKDEIEFDT